MKKIILAMIVTVGILAVSHHALAAPGDLKYSVNLQGVPSGFEVQGITHDGQYLWISDGFSKTIRQINQSTGQTLQTLCVHLPALACADPANPNIGGLEWDKNAAMLWAGQGFQNGASVSFSLYHVNPLNGAIMQIIPVATPNRIPGRFISGLTYDSTTNTLWHSYQSARVFHINTAGTVLGSITMPVSDLAFGEAFDGTSLYHNASQSATWDAEDLLQTDTNGTVNWQKQFDSSFFSDLAYQCKASDIVPVLSGVPVVWSAEHRTLNAIEVPHAACTTLAVTWAGYKAVYTGNGSVDVTWMTSSEINTVGFYVQRSGSTTGTFTVVSPFIFAQGPGIPYEWFDLHPLPGDNWYRIQEITTNGPGDMTEPFEAQPAIVQPTVVLPTPVLQTTTAIQMAAAEREI